MAAAAAAAGYATPFTAHLPAGYHLAPGTLQKLKNKIEPKMFKNKLKIKNRFFQKSKTFKFRYYFESSLSFNYQFEIFIFESNL